MNNQRNKLTSIIDRVVQEFLDLRQRLCIPINVLLHWHKLLIGLIFLHLIFYYFVQSAYWHHSLIPTANFGDFFSMVPEMNLKNLTKINKIGRIRLDWGDFRGQRLFNYHKYVFIIIHNLLIMNRLWCHHEDSLLNVDPWYSSIFGQFGHKTILTDRNWPLWTQNDLSWPRLSTLKLAKF